MDDMMQSVCHVRARESIQELIESPGQFDKKGFTKDWTLTVSGPHGRTGGPGGDSH